ncbi:class I adenylate-forming enzyme family protein [Aquabacterium sp.]|uniref:class I adenylate-forming enzyme family protein n=1 Tax=Aquabacterium sp. TaxID=1872578 RepID=UPI002D14EF85|nr:AMP-binding protein [Aquabacterium sp.]HSW06745.1 AMP-binding protein [Aquabacterium sp.]
MRLIEHFDKAAERWPERAFLVDAAGSRTYREVQLQSHRIAAALRRDGLARGARVAIYSANSAAAFECVIGALRAGAVWVPVSTRNHLDDTVHTLVETGTELLFYGPDVAPQVDTLASRCPGLRQRVALDEHFERWLPTQATFDEDEPGTPDELATLFSSGGTTGRPKGVMMSSAGWEAMIAGTLALQPHPHPIHLVAAPMTHAAGGSALAMLPLGATHVLLPGFDALQVMQAIETYRVTHLFLPPTAIYKLLAHPDVRAHDFSSLRYLNYASAPMAPERVREACEVFGPVMTTAFGQTETGLNVTAFTPTDHAEVVASGDLTRLASCGRAGPFFRVAIMDEQGRLLPHGERGEVVVRGASVMKGYLNNAEETARVSAHGWHHTGDIGQLDAQGWLFLVDRLRDVIVSGGFNVFPSEVERVLLSHPAVQDCAVVGVPDALWGEAVKAVVELKPGCGFDEAALRTLCRERLASHQVPKSFEAWAQLPRSPVGKLLKRTVREHFWDGQARRV